MGFYENWTVNPEKPFSVCTAKNTSIQYIFLNLLTYFAAKYSRKLQEQLKNISVPFFLRQAI